MSAGPHYPWNDFVTACSKGTAEVFVLAGAMDTARSDFLLKKMSEVLVFISQGGLEKPQFFNCKDWENNPNPSIPVKVDAYHFSAGSIYGYLAFFQVPGQKWNIKSFKKEQSGDPRSLPFAEALKDLKIPGKDQK